MSDKVRLALIGAGGMANRVHYPSLAEFDDVEMAGLCDLVEKKLHATADKFEIEKRYTDYKQMIEEVAPDAVYVLMPPYHLWDIVVHCLQQGLHVFIEKPPAVTSYQTRMLAHLADENNCLTMTGFNRRFIPLMQECRSKVLERGNMIQCVSTFYKDHLKAGPYYSGATDILYCDAIHAVDTLRWMGGDVAEVVSDIQKHGRHFETSWIALTRHVTDCAGVLLTNWMVGARVHTFEMHGMGISAFVNPDEGAVIHADGQEKVEELSTTEVADSEENRIYYGFCAENRHFIDCIKANQEPETCFADATKTMELADRIYGNQM